MRRQILLATLFVPMTVGLAFAQPKSDPDWPCIQRKVTTLGVGAIWTGPDIEAAGAWGDDRDAARLARVLASRRTELKEVDGLLDEFLDKKSDGEPTASPANAGSPDQATSADDKAKRLTRVFAGVFEIINGERNQVVNGIVRYAQGQRRMAERIRAEADKLSELREGPSVDLNTPQTKEAQELETKFNWDRRIFDERSQSVTFVCEVPTILEQRLGEIAKRIQARI